MVRVHLAQFCGGSYTDRKDSLRHRIKSTRMSYLPCVKYPAKFRDHIMTCKAALFIYAYNSVHYFICFSISRERALIIS